MKVGHGPVCRRGGAGVGVTLSPAQALYLVPLVPPQPSSWGPTGWETPAQGLSLVGDSHSAPAPRAPGPSAAWHPCTLAW